MKYCNEVMNELKKENGERPSSASGAVRAATTSDCGTLGQGSLGNEGPAPPLKAGRHRCASGGRIPSLPVTPSEVSAVRSSSPPKPAGRHEDAYTPEMSKHWTSVSPAVMDGCTMPRCEDGYTFSTSSTACDGGNAPTTARGVGHIGRGDLLDKAVLPLEKNSDGLLPLGHNRVREQQLWNARKLPEVPRLRNTLRDQSVILGNRWQTEAITMKRFHRSIANSPGLGEEGWDTEDLKGWDAEDSECAGLQRENRPREAAAMRIQEQWRAKRSRRDCMVSYRKTRHAVKALQHWWRVLMLRSAMVQPLRDREAATKIQAHFRGFCVRHRLRASWKIPASAFVMQMVTRHMMRGDKNALLPNLQAGIRGLLLRRNGGLATLRQQQQQQQRQQRELELQQQQQLHLQYHEQDGEVEAPLCSSLSDAATVKSKIPEAAPSVTTPSPETATAPSAPSPSCESTAAPSAVRSSPSRARHQPQATRRRVPRGVGVWGHDMDRAAILRIKILRAGSVTPLARRLRTEPLDSEVERMFGLRPRSESRSRATPIA